MNLCTQWYNSNIMNWPIWWWLNKLLVSWSQLQHAYYSFALFKGTKASVFSLFAFFMSKFIYVKLTYCTRIDLWVVGYQTEMWYQYWIKKGHSNIFQQISLLMHPSKLCQISQNAKLIPLLKHLITPFLVYQTLLLLVLKSWMLFLNFNLKNRKICITYPCTLLSSLSLPLSNLFIIWSTNLLKQALYLNNWKLQKLCQSLRGVTNCFQIITGLR